MIKFFRKIRKKLLSESKFNKYLMYAVGEIILVVIGILIALQINNWNDDQKMKRSEIVMLTELNKAIEIDLTNLKSGIPYLKKVEKSFVILTKFKNGKTLSKDSIRIVLDIIRGYGYVFSPNTGPYESIKSSGLDKVENLSIRNEISRLYDGDIPLASSWINEVLRVELFNRNKLMDELFHKNYKVVRDSVIQSELDISNLTQVMQSQTMEKLIASRWPLSGTIARLERIKKSMQEVKKQIEKELKKK